MSVQNFKPTLWEGALLHNFHSVSTADAVCVKPSEINGNKVIFNRVGAGTIKDYEGTIEWDDINTTPIEMTFDKKKYFAFSLELPQSIPHCWQKRMIRIFTQHFPEM